MKTKFIKIVLTTMLGLLIVGIAYFLLTSNKKFEKTSTDKSAETEAETIEPGTIPVEYPAVKTSVVIGQYVLAPPIEVIEKANKKGLHMGIFEFYKGKMIEPGEKESLIEDYLGEENYIPNSLIVPINPDQSVKEGDIILTWFEQEDLSMVKGIVTDVSNPETPHIRYLGDFYEEEVKLEKNSFQKLTNILIPGITILYENEDGTTEQSIVINVSEDKILTFSDQTLKVKNLKNLTVIPQKNNIKIGDNIITPFISNYKNVEITNINKEIGEVTAEYEWAGKILSDTFYFGEIKKL